MIKTVLIALLPLTSSLFKILRLRCFTHAGRPCPTSRVRTAGQLIAFHAREKSLFPLFTAPILPLVPDCLFSSSFTVLYCRGNSACGSVGSRNLFDRETPHSAWVLYACVSFHLLSRGSSRRDNVLIIMCNMYDPRPLVEKWNESGFCSKLEKSTCSFPRYRKKHC